jgi:predicted SPOUT superfamily RNA methylase MTH1
MRGPRTLSVLLPASFFADADTLQQKTMKAGFVGRACAIFQVQKIVIYADGDPQVSNQTAEAKLLSMLLQYMETPQYLRKILFPRRGELRYAGLLPPLRTPHHPLEDEKASQGDYREAVVLNSSKNCSILELGLSKKGVLNERLRVGERVTVKLGRSVRDRIEVKLVSKADIGEYWGYEVKLSGNLADALKATNADYVVGTSRHGQNLYEAVDAIKNSNPGSIAVVFGGPYAGLLEICKRQGVDAKELFDVVVNTIPNQGTATVRTEEALIATLALLNVLLRG